MDGLGGRGIGDVTQFWGRIREADGFVQHIVPLLEFVAEVELFFDGGEREKHDLAKVGKGVGGADGHAVLRHGSENLAEDIVDIGGGEEVAADGRGEFGAELSRFEELLLVARVEDAKGGVAGRAGQTTAAAVGSLKSTAIGVGGFAGRGFL